MRIGNKNYIKKLLFSTILASGVGFSYESFAFTLDIHRTELARPWGYDTKGQEIVTGDYSMRDAGGNLTITNDFQKSRFAAGFGYNFASQGKLDDEGNGSNSPDVTKITGNEFTVVTEGSFNTVIINNEQINHAEVGLNGTLTDFE